MCEVRIIRIKEVSSKCGISIPTIYRLIAQGRFPVGRRISGKATGWISTEIDSWILHLPVSSHQR